MEYILELCDRIRSIGFRIHEYLGPGHLEKVYENALHNRLHKTGIQAVAQHPLQVRDEDGTPPGDYLADLLVEDRLIIEVKAVRGLAPEHVAQVLGYLKTSRIEHGLLMNFGGAKFEVKKCIFNNCAGHDSPRRP